MRRKRSFSTVLGCLLWPSKCHENEECFGGESLFPPKHRTAASNVLGIEQALETVLGETELSRSSLQVGR